MVATNSSKRAVFQTIIDTDEKHWPYYRCPSEEYTADDLDALKHDISTLAREWFQHDAHEDVVTFICTCPLAYFEFASYDAFPDWHAQSKPVVPLLRAVMLMHLHDWEHETPLVAYLDEQEDLADALGFESVPSQATFWRARHERFSRDLLQAIKQCADFIRIHATWNRVDVPDTIDTAGSDSTSRRGPSTDSEGPSQKEVLSRAGELTDQAKRLLFPAFGFDREKGRIHENAFWELQTYTGLRDGMCVNEGARSFLVDSTRERTPLGHIHRQYLRKLSIVEIREMYGRAVRRLLDEAEQTAAFHRAVTVAIDITTDTPFTGDREGYETEIIGTKENNNEYAYHWATIQIVGEDLPLILDARPVRKGESRTEIVMELLDSAQEMVSIDLVLMDREFDGQHLLERVVDRGLDYLVPKKKRTSEKAKAKQLERFGIEEYVEDRGLHLGKNEWHDTRLIYSAKDNWDGELDEGHERYAVFMTSYSDAAPVVIEWYHDRWGIESGYKSLKTFMADTTSKHFGLRFFYFAFACLLYSLWRLVDLLVQLQFTDEYERDPLVTANDVLTLAKKRTGVG
jgi:IS4 transposase